MALQLDVRQDSIAAHHRHADQERERLRLRSLERSGLLDTGDEERFDRLTRQARALFGVSAASISLVGEHQQYLKSRMGALEQVIPRDAAFCSVTIEGESELIVPDTLAHPRFRSNTYVVRQPLIRFYAGMPLRGPGGWFIGSLCILDTQPRTLSITEVRLLRRLAAEAELEINAA
jgi:GAF domain-containing protein